MNELELYHYGIKGMKWGVRRYQNSDGSYTHAGRKRRAATTVETTNSQIVRQKRQEMKKLRQEYKQAKRAYSTERDKLNESYVGNQLTIEKLGRKWGVPQSINRYMNEGDSIISARVKTYAKIGSTIVAGYAMTKFMQSRI